MKKEYLLQEAFAPDTYKVLVSTIFLRQNSAEVAQPHLLQFLAAYPTAADLSCAAAGAIKADFLESLQFGDERSRELIKFTKYLIADPPKLNILRTKPSQYKGPISEVAHLPGVGQLDSDIWEISCKKDFYAKHGKTIEEPFKTLLTDSSLVQSVIARKRREEAEMLHRTSE